jgi:AcrR family transcriptional regulator
MVRTRILDQAAHLFLTIGYAETTVRRIAGAVGIKAASLYHHFGSKDEVFESILTRGIQVMVESFDIARSTSKGLTTKEQLRFHIRAHLGSLFEHGPYTAVHVSSFHFAPPIVKQQIVPIRDGYEALWTSLLNELNAKDQMSMPTSVALHRLILFGAMNSSIEWFDPDGDYSLDSLANAITDQFWEGVSPK